MEKETITDHQIKTSIETERVIIAGGNILQNIVFAEMNNHKGADPTTTDVTKDSFELKGFKAFFKF